MKAIFAHDAVFTLGSADNEYYNERFPYTTWTRYLSVFEHLIVIGRGRTNGTTSGSTAIAPESLSSGPRVTHKILPNVSGVVLSITNRVKAKKMMIDSILRSDVVIARLPSELGLMAVVLASKFGVPCAVEVVAHAWDGLWYHGSWKGKAYAPILHHRVRQAVLGASHVVYVTKQYLQSAYPTHGNSVACSNVHVTSTDREVINRRIRRIRRSSGKFVVGLVAFMEAQYKGIDTAIKALSLLRSEQMELRILGGGDYTRWAALAKKLEISERVHFFGAIPPGEPVLSWLDDVDIYIQPSRTEGLPRALIEAMSRGLPCLGSMVGGIPELLTTDALFAPGNPEQLAYKLLRLAHDKDKMIELAHMNHRSSDQYNRDVLEEVRTTFWQGFKQFAYDTTKASNRGGE